MKKEKNPAGGKREVLSWSLKNALFQKKFLLKYELETLNYFGLNVLLLFIQVERLWVN